jgi:hypothetical protein
MIVQKPKVPLTLSPLKYRDAVSALLKVKPEPKKPKGQNKEKAK